MHKRTHSGASGGTRSASPATSTRLRLQGLTGEQSRDAQTQSVWGGGGGKSCQVAHGKSGCEHRSTWAGHPTTHTRTHRAAARGGTRRPRLRVQGLSGEQPSDALVHAQRRAAARAWRARLRTQGYSGRPFHGAQAHTQRRSVE
mmetsp:Transcript_29255/g.72086  ORF Transcript_29255/g.72086 Transcript_29255/m.72086 type:complete len:144 (-) Transcript_29255:146-577(-)